MKMRPYVVHLRDMESDGNDGQRQVPGTWAATVVFIPDSLREGYYYVGMALCNPDDHFNKKLGREIAEGRASTSNAWIADLNMPEQIPFELYVFWAQEYIAQQIEDMRPDERTDIFVSLDIPDEFLSEDPNDYAGFYEVKKQQILACHKERRGREIKH